MTMMELNHSSTLNEDALAQLPEAKRPIFVFEWLRFFDKVLITAQKVLPKKIFKNKNFSKLEHENFVNWSTTFR